MGGQPTFRFWGSALSAKLLAIPFALATLVLAMRVSDVAPAPSEREAFVCDTVRQWRAEHGAGADLWLVRVDVNFEGRDGSFVTGEGAVVTPAGADVPGLQRVIATSGFPSPVTTIDFEGVRNPLWTYPGSVHRDMSFTAISLVRMDATAAEVKIPPERRIADEMARYEASLRVREHADHGLESCKQFPAWARSAAGSGDAEQKVNNVAAALASMVDVAAIEHDSPCFGLRDRKLTPHLAQVLAVMAAREAGIPALAVSAADPARRYLVAVRTAPLTWRMLDVLHAEAGFVDGPVPLLSKAPLIRPFPYAQHDLWQPRAAAYGPEGAFSFTAWFDAGAKTHKDSDYTRVMSTPLAEACT